MTQFVPFRFDLLRASRVKELCYDAAPTFPIPLSGWRLVHHRCLTKRPALGSRVRAVRGVDPATPPTPAREPAAVEALQAIQDLIYVHHVAPTVGPVRGRCRPRPSCLASRVQKGAGAGLDSNRRNEA